MYALAQSQIMNVCDMSVLLIFVMMCSTYEDTRTVDRNRTEHVIAGLSGTATFGMGTR